jgi:signal transduction histidine kinase
MRAEENTMNALEERRRLNDQKAKFISMASHEFRTPITSIQMSTDIIDLKLRDLDIPHKKDIQKHIGIINKDVERFLGIMNDILTLGKTEKNIMTANRAPISMLEIVDECASKIREITYEERELTISVLGDVREVLADKSQIEHIIENLISNAFKFSKGRQAPELTLVYHKDRFVIQVRDYGIGIPDADQSHLFSSFYRASNTSSIRGTGLGLVIIKNLVRLHKGTIEIKSKENEGTEVIILIKG